MMKTNYIEDYATLFDAIQRAEIFDDQKTMADAIPKFPIDEINEKFNQEKPSEKADLKEFVLKNFIIKEEESSEIKSENSPIEEHIHFLWNHLTRETNRNEGTLMQLPKSYVVPGGRFNEFFYWDSYFTMLGLQVSGRTDLMENIVENCAYLIENFGFVPNANRTYFLTRSQPPYFSLMIELLMENADNTIDFEQKYAATLEKEYHFWMNGSENLQPDSTHKRVVKLNDGTTLNRHFDDENSPRPESYFIDVKDASESDNPEFYRNIRAACESGLDFSSRWLSDGENLRTINILELLPLELNCLLWHEEKTLAKIHQKQNPEKSEMFLEKANRREKAINQYFWDTEEKTYKDYNWVSQKPTASFHLGCVMPLFLKISSAEKAEAVSKIIKENFLQKGGLVTTTKKSGQQWDFPNAWAPYQWLGFVAMKNFGYTEISNEIKNNWCNNIERVYKNTGKLMEKYNAVDTETLAGGGEYPNQDGFGWTNGVYLKMKNS